MAQSGKLVGATDLMTMYEFKASKRNLAYVAENRLKTALEAEIPHMVIVANDLEGFNMSQRISVGSSLVEEMRSTGLENDGRKDQRLDYIYDDERLGFEKDHATSNTKM